MAGLELVAGSDDTEMRAQEDVLVESTIATIVSIRGWIKFLK